MKIWLVVAGGTSFALFFLAACLGAFGAISGKIDLKFGSSWLISASWTEVYWCSEWPVMIL